MLVAWSPEVTTPLLVGSEVLFEAQAVEQGGEGEDDGRAGEGSGDRGGNAVLGEGVVVAAEGGEVEPGAEGVAEEVGEEDVLAGEGEGFRDGRDGVDVGEEVEGQPERG